MIAPESLVQQIPVHEGHVAVVATDALMNHMRDLPLDEKLRGSLRLMGAEFWDEDLGYVRDNTVSLCGIGGVPIAVQHDSVDVISHRITETAERSKRTMELSAGFSYLNSGNLQEGDLYRKVTGMGHFSIAHTVTANILVAGLTTGVECEFDAQRDMVHLSRVTVARTAVQTRPPIVAPDKTSYILARQITEHTEILINQARSEKPNRDEHEILNRLFPTAKATALLVTGSLRSLSKLVDQRTDPGKEREYREILTKMNGMLGVIWPELFSTSKN